MVENYFTYNYIQWASMVLKKTSANAPELWRVHAVLTSFSLHVKHNPLTAC
jgi:hypothetical protein